MVLDDLHFSGLHCFDWLATGLWPLDDLGEIEAHVRVTATTSLFRRHLRVGRIGAHLKLSATSR